MTDLDSFVGIVSKQERPRSSFRFESNEDARTFEEDVDSDEIFIVRTSAHSNVILPNILNLERSRPVRSSSAMHSRNERRAYHSVGPEGYDSTILGSPPARRNPSEYRSPGGTVIVSFDPISRTRIACSRSFLRMNRG